MVDKNLFKDIDLNSLDQLDENQLESLYTDLNTFNDYVYNFVVNYHKSIYKSKDYGTGITLSMLEAHLITDISNTPGITANMLARKWDKTSAFISQSLKKLEELNLIYREVNEENRKYYNLYITDKGRKFDLAHKKYDVKSIIKTNRELMKKFPIEDLINMRIIMKEYIDIIDNE